MAITRITGARIIQSYVGAPTALINNYDDMLLQRLDNGRMAAIWPTAGGGSSTLQFTTLDALGVTHTALQTIDTADTTRYLNQPAMASGVDGSVFTVWVNGLDTGNETSDDTYGRVFNAAGTPLAAKFHLSGATAGGEFTPSVARLGNGNYLAVWTDTQATSGLSVTTDTIARVFSPTGAPIGAEFVLNTNTANIQLGTDTMALADGRAVSVWMTGTLGLGSFTWNGISGRFVSAAGAATGVDFNVDTIAAGRGYETDGLKVLALGNGGFAVVWREFAGDEQVPTVEEIHVQRFSAAGAKVGAEMVVESAVGDEHITQFLPVELSNGGFAIAWRLFNAVTPVAVPSRVRVYDMNGVEIGTETSLQTIANPGLAVIAELELMQNGHVMALGPTANLVDIATQVFDFGDERLLGTSVGDTLFGKNGVNDVILGLEGADTLSGLGGDDVMDGGTGVDSYIGGHGNDAYYVRNLGLDGRVEDSFTELANQGTDGITTTVTLNLNEARYANIENVYMEGTANIIIGGSIIANTIVGNSGNNGIYGLGSRDIMRGGAGADTFFYLNTAETGVTATTRDLIQDFEAGIDKINLTAADSDTVLAGNQNFTFLATQGAAFTGVAGQLRFRWEDNANNALDKTIVEADLNGDRVADLQIEMTAFGTNPGLKALTAADFVL